MPRTVVKPSPAREPVPDWWEAEFHRRQGLARKNIVDYLRRAGRALSYSELRSFLSHATKREQEHATNALVAQGLIRRFERTEPFHYCGEATRIYTYYELTEQA